MSQHVTSQSQAGMTALSTHSPKDGKKILLVEDNRLVQRAVQRQFEVLGCVVEAADTGAQALEKIQTSHYDLIILDLGLPDQDGCAVAIAMSQWQAQRGQTTPPMVALSAHIDSERRQQCLAAGMIRVLTKPLIQQHAQELLELFAAAKTEDK